MQSGITSEIIHPQRLTLAERQHLADEVYPVHSQVFHAEDKESFTKLFVESRADHTTIHLRRNAARAIVAYAAFHRYDKVVRGVKTAIFRAEAGALRDYRGHNSLIGVALRQVLRYKLTHPLRPMLYLGMLLHPTSYMFFTKYGEEVWPNYKQPMPPAIKELLADLSKTFSIHAAQPGNPLVAYVGVSTQETEEERLYWRTCDKPEARFFVETNPNYSNGYGLLTLAPINIQAILRGIGRFARDRAQRQFEPLLATVQQLPLVKQMLGKPKIAQLLRQTSLCAALPDADLALLAQTADLIILPSGRYLFRAGDASDELYVIARGGVYVVTERAGKDQPREERIIDQLALGAMFGELALLSGEARSATIRTATKTTLIRLKRKQLITLMATHPTLHTAIWGAYNQRRFADLTASSTAQFAQLTRQQRLAWLAQGQMQTLGAQEQATIQSPWLFVPTGTVEIQQQHQWTTLRAPALLQTASALQLVAQSPTHYVCLPEPDVPSA
ncbi:MAG: cyclic nucleotide-binding domain-containing protein [Caldilineaceae bacterium]